MFYVFEEVPKTSRLLFLKYNLSFVDGYSFLHKTILNLQLP